MDGKTWRVVPSCPDYEVSGDGVVRRCEPGRSTRVGKVIKASPDASGYLRVCLRVNGRPRKRGVHQMVAEAFIGPCPKGMTINHKNCKKTDNRASNLEYCTRAENLKHAHANGVYPRGEDTHTAKLTDERVLQIKRLLPTHNNCELGRRFGVSDVAIRKIRLGKTWKHVA